jgi:pimeloyl-ACP methyl ester carboxylesterase
MLLLHGIGHRWQMWTPVLDSLAREYEVVALDLPGFGKSPRSAFGSEITLDTAAALLGDVMDELGWDRAHIVGNSLGGWLALELGVRDRALSICALAPAGLWSDYQAVGRRLRFWFTLWVEGSRRLTPAHRLLRFRAARTLAMSGVFGRPWKVPPDIAIGDARNLATSAFDEVFEAGTNQRFTGGQSIEVPVTVAWHSRDPLFRANRSTVAELPPHARVVQLKGCGHVPTWDDPPLVLETIRSTTDAALSP